VGMAIVLALSFASAVCFALALVLTKFGLRTVEPRAGAGISVPATAVLFLVLSPLTVDFAAWHGQAALLFAAVGLVFPIAVTRLTFAANRRIGAGLTGALGNLTPLFAVALAILVLGEVPRPWQLAGMAAITGGVVLLFAGSRAGPGGVPAWALLLPLAAALVRGATQPVVKLGLSLWPDPFAAVTIGYLVSAVVALAGRRAGPSAVPGGTGRLWFVAVGVCNGLAVLLLYMALARGPVAVVACLVACYPLPTLLLDRLIHGRRGLPPAVPAGVAITVAGVVLLLAG